MVSAPTKIKRAPRPPARRGLGSARRGVSLIIPVYNNGADFKRCLEAALAATTPADEVIIVSDSDPQEGWRGAPHTDRVRIIVLQDRKGPAAARNAGAAVARRDVLFFVDADVQLPADTVERVRSAFQSRPDLDALVGSYDADPADPAFHSRYRNLLHHYIHQSAKSSLHTFWAGCGAIRTAAFIESGGFDEFYDHPSIEDIEFGYRVSARGFTIEIDKELQVKHLKSWAPRQILLTDIMKRAAPWSRLLLKKGAVENNLNVSYDARLSILAALGLPIAAITALWAPVVALIAAVALLGALIALNSGFYRFLWRNEGPGFTLRALPWHLIYFWTCMIGFMIGAVWHLRDLLGSEQSSESAKSLRWATSTRS